MQEKLLYHGTIHEFDQIDVYAGKGYKDFGKGFYATADKAQAERFARLRKRQTEYRNQFRQIKVYPTAYRYNLIFLEDDAFSDRELKIKIYKEADLEWIKFVYRNRKLKNKEHNYDIVIGPTADDATKVIIDGFEDKLKKSNYADEVFLELLRALKPENLKKQYYFGTDISLKYLVFCRVRREIV